MQKLRRIFEVFIATVVALVAPEKDSLRTYSTVSAAELLQRLTPAPTLPSSLAGWLTALFSYRDPHVREIVWEIKYRRHSVLAEKIGELLYEEMKKCAVTMRTPVGEKIILAPISSSKERRRERGFNQCEVLCETIMKCDVASKIFEYAPDLLVKTKNTAHQADLQRTDRLKNLIDTYAIRDPKICHGKIIFTVDDVITTGATLREARRVLVAADTREVRGFAIAH